MDPIADFVAVDDLVDGEGHFTGKFDQAGALGFSVIVAGGLAQDAVVGGGVFAVAQIGRGGVILATPDALSGIGDFFEVLQLVDAAFLVSLDGFIDQLGELFVKGRVEIHALGDGAFEAVGDGIGFGGSAFDFLDFLGEAFLVKDVDQFGNGFDVGGLDVAVDQLADFLFVILVVDHFGVTLLNGGAQVVEEGQVGFVGFDALFGHAAVEIERSQGNLHGAGVSGQGVVEGLAMIFGFEETLQGFGILLVGDGLENIPQFRVALGQFGDFTGDIGDGVLDVGGVEAFEGVVSVDGVVEFAQDTVIVNDIAEIFAFKKPVDAGDGLQDGMFAQGLIDIQDGVAGFVEADQQFIDHHQDFKALGAGKLGDQFVVVLVLGSETLHHALPEAFDFGIAHVVHFFVAFAGIGLGDDDFAGDNAKIIQVFFVFERHQFAGGGKLGFETGALKVGFVVFAEVVGNLGDALFGLVDGFGAAEFALEVGLLVVGQALGDALEPGVDNRLVDLEFGHAAFVEQGHNRLVFDGAAHTVGVDNAAEFERGGFLFFEQGRASETDVAGVGKNLAHANVDAAILAAMAFIDQDKDVGVGIGNFPFGDGLEFVDDSGDDIGGAMPDEFDQVFARFGLDRAFAAGFEGFPDLGVEVDAVGNENDARVADVGMQGQGFGEHHHRERFAAAGGMPDDAAGAFAFGIEVGDAGEGLLDGEILLVAGNLFDPGIEDDVLVNQFEQAFGAQ